MLRKKDIQLLRGMIEDVLEEKLEKKFDEKFAEQDKEFIGIIDERFAEQDKEFIGIIDERFAEQENRIDRKFAEQEARIDRKFAEQGARIDQKFAEQEHSFDAKLDARLKENINFILEELERTRTILENKIDRVDKRLSEVEEYYRIRKLDDENVSMIMKMHDELEKRVARLEEKVS